MGMTGGQGLAGLGQQTGAALAGYGGQYGGMASLLPQLQQGDIQSQMGMGALGRGREQSQMDLNYQNFTGQYNLPMQTLQNVGALTASLGPMAGGFGYAGGAPAYNNSYTPSGGMGGGATPGTTPNYPNYPNYPNFGGIGNGTKQTRHLGFSAFSNISRRRGYWRNYAGKTWRNSHAVSNYELSRT